MHTYQQLHINCNQRAITTCMQRSMAILQTLYREYLFESLDVRAVLLGFVVFLVLAWVVHGYRNRVLNPPPGPRSWPIIGCLPQFVNLARKHKNAHEMAQALAKQYGRVCYIQLPFGIKMVFVSGYEAVSESLTCSGFGEQRPPFPQSNPDELLRGQGIINSSGETWREHRRFSLTVLRGFGVGKRSFEDQIGTESAHLLEEIESRQTKPIEPTHLLSNAVSNIICSVVFGKRFEYDDPEFKQLLHLLEISFNFSNFSGFMLMIGFIFMPKLSVYLTRIPLFKTEQMNGFTQLRRKLQDIVDEHRNTVESDDMRDYIDVYISESQKKSEQGVHTYLSDTELRVVLQDLFLAGTETTSTTLRWALLYMMKFPDIQTMVQEEIDSVVGRDRLPRLSDKPNLPYTQAVIHEIQRFGSIVGFTGLRYATRNTEFCEFIIPKGSLIQSDLYSISRDALLWDEPSVFKPNRFLDDEGRVVTPLHHMPFGAGKRVCLGEQLARMEIFIFFTHLMHRFSFKKPAGVGNIDIGSKAGTVLTPYPYKMRAIVR